MGASTSTRARAPRWRTLNMVVLKPPYAHYRRNLPHWQHGGAAIYLTFCTLDRFELPPPARQLVLGHCLHDHNQKLYLHCAVVMPDHVHLLLNPWPNATGEFHCLAEITKSIKGASAHSVNRLLGRKGPLWQHESFDHLLRANERGGDVVEYIRQNPVRKGIATRPEDYPWFWLNPEIAPPHR